jgi:tetratricopeptide (TPR) repeat protein
MLEDYRGAIADYTKAIELFPDFAGAYLNRSEAKRSLRDEKGAYLDYERAMSIMEDIHVNGYDSLTVRQFADSAYFNRIIEFEADFVNVNLKDSLNNRSVDLEMGFMAQLLPDPMLIVKKNESIYEVEGLQNFDSKGPAGMTFVLSNREFDFSMEDAYFRLMEADSLLNANPHSARAYFLKGIINTMVKNYNTAMDELDRSLQYDPNQPLVYLNKGYILFEMAEHASAENKFSSPVTISWDKADEKAIIPQESPLSPDYNKAVEIYDFMISRWPDFAFGYFNRANLKVRLKDYSGAVADYSAAIEKQPNLAEAFYNRALTLIFLGNLESACQDLSKAGELGLQQAYRVIQQYCKKQ